LNKNNNTEAPKFENPQMCSVEKNFVAQSPTSIQHHNSKLQLWPLQMHTTLGTRRPNQLNKLPSKMKRKTSFSPKAQNFTQKKH